jgi:hypothetical protein
MGKFMHNSTQQFVLDDIAVALRTAECLSAARSSGSARSASPRIRSRSYTMRNYRPY